MRRIILSVVMVAFATAPSAALAQNFAGTYLIVLSDTGQALDAAAADVAKNQCRVQHFECTGSQNQLWEVAPVSDGKHSIRCKASGKALDARTQDGGRNGSAIQLYDYHGGSNQLWSFVHCGGGQYSIVNASSGRVLDADKPTMMSNGGRFSCGTTALPRTRFGLCCGRSKSLPM